MSRLILANIIVWACLIGAGVGAVQVAQTSDEAARPAADAARSKPAEITWLSLELPDRDSFDEVASRPLFSVSRRPPAMPEPAERAAVLPPVLLTGIAGRPGGLRALVLHPEEGVLNLEKGSEVAGWIVDEVTMTAIRVIDPTGRADPVVVALGERAAEGGSAPVARTTPSAAEPDPDEGFGTVGVFDGVGYD